MNEMQGHTGAGMIRAEISNVGKGGTSGMNHLKEFIREVPDYPKPGILFYDLTTLLQNPGAFHGLVDELCDHYAGQKVDAVVGIEARGFILAPALAYRLKAGFVPVRKPKKLPSKTVSVTYQLEYGTDTLEIHEDAVKPGQSVIICDDLLATGGTAAATAKLVEKLGGKVEGAAFAVELTFLNGRSKLNSLDIFSLIQYDK
jgi:adenine phosphoribosyltransferase